MKTPLMIVGGSWLALGLSACASLNTPAQDLGYERWARCSQPYTQLQRVDVDGRIVFQVTDTADQQKVFQCLADANRTGTPLPPAQSVRPAGGP